MRKPKYILKNIKYKLGTKLPIVMIGAATLFQECDQFNSPTSFVIAYDPALSPISLCDSVYKCAQYDDSVTVKIYMVPDTTTRNFSCERFSGVAKSVQSCFYSCPHNTYVSLSGEIIIHESGCKERGCEVPVPFKPGMYKDDSIWFSCHYVNIRIYSK